MKEKLGATAVVFGLIGTMFGVGGVENSMDNVELFTAIGLAATSLMLMQLGVWMIKDEI